MSETQVLFLIISSRSVTPQFECCPFRHQYAILDDINQASTAFETSQQPLYHKTHILSFLSSVPALRLLREAQFVGVNARQDPHGDESHGRVKDPRLNLERVAHEPRVRSGAKRRQQQQQVDVAADAVPLPERPGAGRAAVQRRRGPHGEADEVLAPEEQRQRAAQRAVEAGKVLGAVALLVEVDGGEAGGKSRKGGQVEVRVHGLADALLAGRVRWLQREDGLDEEEEAGDLREGVPREEDQRPRQEAAGQGEGKGDDGCLGDEAGACAVLVGACGIQ